MLRNENHTSQFWEEWLILLFWDMIILFKEWNLSAKYIFFISSPLLTLKLPTKHTLDFIRDSISLVRIIYFHIFFSSVHILKKVSNWPSHYNLHIWQKRESRICWLIGLERPLKKLKSRLFNKWTLKKSELGLFIKWIRVDFSRLGYRPLLRILWPILLPLVQIIPLPHSRFGKDSFDWVQTPYKTCIIRFLHTPHRPSLFGSRF